MQNYAEENLELHERLLELQKRYDTEIAALKQRNAELESQQVSAVADKHKVGITLKNGKTVMYPANCYALLPNTNAPMTIEFRMADRETNTYEVVGHAQWSDVSEIRDPSP